LALQCRWLLLAKLRQQSGDADGYVAAQNQALKLQSMLLEHVRQPDKLGGAAASVFDRQSAAGRANKSKALAKSLLSSDGTASAPSGVAPAAADMTASASGKAASICFDLAEFHRHRHQFDKVPGCTLAMAATNSDHMCTVQ
jgi:hypothetical protein